VHIVNYRHISGEPDSVKWDCLNMWVNPVYHVGIMIQWYSLFQTVVSCITESQTSRTVCFIVSRAWRLPLTELSISVSQILGLQNVLFIKVLRNIRYCWMQNEKKYLEALLKDIRGTPQILT
jgi:hypothetical protein